MNIKVISAGAGTGKTFNLARELLDDIASGAARPDAVVAITYTNKAAGELASRLRQRLLSAGHATAAAQVRDGYLGTVHSVCQRLLTELAFEAGTSPYPEPVPAGYAETLFSQAVSQVAGEQLDALAGVIDSLQLEPAARPSSSWGRPPATWRSVLRTVVNLARENRLDAAVLGDSAQRSIEEVAELLGASLGSAESADARLGSTLAPIATRLAADRAALEQKGKTLSAAHLKRERWVQQMQRCFRQGRLPSWSDLSAGVGHLGTKALREAGSDWLDAWSAHLRHPRFQAEIAAIIDGLLGMAAAAEQAFTGAKQAERLLEFDDMLAQAAALLKLPAARDKLAGRIDLLMVDEFQDTSPVQLEVVMALSGLARRTVWVGDRKQGIFGFQGSDPALMLAATDAVLGGASPHVLPKSYRSRPPLVHFCSEVFAEALAGDGFAEDEVRMAPACPEPAELEGTAAVHLWSTTKDPASQKRSVSEGTGLARHLRRVLAAGSLRVREAVDDRTQPAPTRAATCGDVAILARTNKQCRAIAAALKDAGLPVQVAQDGLAQTPEALVLRAGLALVADPLDAMAAAELARMLGDLSDPGRWLSERIAFVEAAPKNRYQPAFADNPRLQRLRAALDHGRHWSPGEAVVEVLAALDLHTVVLGWPDPETHLANLEVLRAVAEDYEKTCATRRTAATVSGLVRHLETLPAATEQALPTAQDAVRVLTYHKAKGLEWPVVVCASLGTFFGVEVHQPHIVAAEEFALSDPLQGRSVRWWPWPYAGKSKGLALADRARETDLVAERQAANRAEHRRLLYVAFTRACDHLVLSRVDHKSGGTAWLDLLQDPNGTPLLDLPWSEQGACAVALGAEVFACTAATVSAVPPEGEGGPRRASHWFETVAVPEERLPQRLTPSAHRLPEAAQAAVRVLETHDLGTALVLRPKTGQMASVGDALHGFFAVDPGGDDPARTALADRLRSHHGVDAVLSAAGMRTLSDRFLVWLAGHAPGAARLPEWPVRWLRADGRAMAGDIDLLVPLEGGWLLLDHKSTTGDAAYRDHKLRSEWSGQLAAYRAAVEAATGQPVLEVWVHLPVQGEVVRVEVPR